jgi:hypothetical protein
MEEVHSASIPNRTVPSSLVEKTPATCLRIVSRSCAVCITSELGVVQVLVLLGSD